MVASMVFPFLEMERESVEEVKVRRAMRQFSRKGRKKDWRFVSFNDDVTIIDIPNRYYYTKKERGELYWSKREINRIGREIRELASKLDGDGHDDDDNDDDEEGGTIDDLLIIKHFTNDAVVERKMARYRVTDAVRVRQEKYGKIDDSWVFQYYKQISHPCVQNAYLRAIVNVANHLASAPFSQIIVR